MPITLVPDSLALLTFLFTPADCLTPIWPPSMMVAILKYGGRAQFLNFLILKSAILQ
jgi:hypothetical protein